MFSSKLAHRDAASRQVAKTIKSTLDPLAYAEPVFPMASTSVETMKKVSDTCSEYLKRYHGSGFA